MQHALGLRPRTMVSFVEKRCEFHEIKPDTQKLKPRR